ncbi:MAG: hypothetical protein CSYNP_03140 [Syntrophus sp. SKADARSKE-3]|nr:hypothetical protein [Syntrophus sp. SKADARSKE-3]
MIEEKFRKHLTETAKKLVEKVYGVEINKERWEKEADILMAKAIIDIYWRIYSYKDTDEFKKIHGFNLMQKFLTKERTTNNDIVTGYDGG